MSTIKSSDEHLTLNADGSSKDIKFQANGVEKASISSAGAFTSTTIDATKLTSQLPSGIGIGVTPVSDNTLMQSVELGAGSAITGYKTSGAPNTYLTNNVKFNSGAASLYKATDEASRIVMDSSGKFYFDVAASGTAGTAISWTTALNITNDGRGLSQFTAKAWCNFGMESGSIRDSHNVGSITDNSTGNFSINFSNNMANANYAASALAGNYVYSKNHWDYVAHSYNYATNHFRVTSTNNDTDLLTDTEAFSVIIFGD